MSTADPISSDARAGIGEYSFPFLRFLVAPSYDQLHSLSGSSSFFWPAPYDLGPSFDIFALAVPQAGSPRIAFASNRDGNVQIYLMNADGSGQVRLTNGGANDDAPRWSPGGAKILFQSDRDDPANGTNDVYVMNADGTGQTRLTFGAEGVTDEQPVWSRDGSRIAFVSTRDGDKEVYVMNADGTNQTRLTNDPGNDDAPYWSPDGSKLVFRSDRLRDCCDPTSQVWVMNADGAGLANLSGSRYGDYSASWDSGGGNQPPVADAGDLTAGSRA